MSPKELKKLAETCRKAGIKTYKDSEVEFTLADDKPVSNYTKRTHKDRAGAVSDNAGLEDIASDGQLTEEQLMLWSTIDLPGNTQ